MVRVLRSKFLGFNGKGNVSFQILGYKVQGLVRVQSSRFRVWGLGFGVWGLGFGVRGLGLKVKGLGSRV